MCDFLKDLLFLPKFIFGKRFVVLCSRFLFVTTTFSGSLSMVELLKLGSIVFNFALFALG